MVVFYHESDINLTKIGKKWQKRLSTEKKTTRFGTIIW